MGNKLRDVFNPKPAIESYGIRFRKKEDMDYFNEVLQKIGTGEVSGMQKFDMEYEVIHKQKLGEDVYSDEEETVVSTMLGPSATPVELPVKLDSGETTLRMLRQISEKGISLSYVDNPIVEFKVTISNTTSYEATFDSRIIKERARKVKDLFRAYDELYAIVSVIMSGELSNDRIMNLADVKEFWKRVYYVEEKLGVEFDISEMNDADGIVIDKLFLLLTTDIPLSHPQNRFTQTLTEEEWNACKGDITEGRVLRLVWTEERMFHVFNQDIKLDTERIIPFATVEDIDLSQRDKVVIKYGPGEYGLKLIEQLPKNMEGVRDVDEIDKRAVDFYEYCRNNFYTSNKES